MRFFSKPKNEEKSKRPMVDFAQMSQDELLAFFIDRFEETYNQEQKHVIISEHRLVPEVNFRKVGTLLGDIDFEYVLKPYLASQGYVSRIKMDLINPAMHIVEIFKAPIGWEFVN